MLCGTLVGGSSLIAPVIQNKLILFQPIDIQLQQEGSGYCYIIVSLRNMGTTYIGQALSLVNRLNQHNRGISSLQASDPRLRPWSLISFVCGFDGNHDMMHRFEINWQRRQEHMLQAGMITMPEQIADVPWMIITERNWDGLGSDLRYVRAGMFSLC
jgi:predicted GIY-YIG superfamily endonuclease